MSFNSYKNRANKKGFEFEIPPTIFEILKSRPCYFCRVKKNAVGIDRLDNNKGYISGNCVPCCWDCNRSKSNKTLKDYREYLLRFNPNLKLSKDPLVVHWVEEEKDFFHTRIAPSSVDLTDLETFYREEW